MPGCLLRLFTSSGSIFRVYAFLQHMYIGTVTKKSGASMMARVIATIGSTIVGNPNIIKSIPPKIAAAKMMYFTVVVVVLPSSVAVMMLDSDVEVEVSVAPVDVQVAEELSVVVAAEELLVDVSVAVVVEDSLGQTALS